MKLLSVTQAAAILPREDGGTGVSRERVKALIREGRLPAQKIGTQWALRPQDVAAYKPLAPHRPKKVAR